MGMTLTEKILARHAGLDVVEPGQIINAKVDLPTSFPPRLRSA
jgi:3-isopropylmalate/(R)-2-methylmalate dehydratase large subunit